MLRPRATLEASLLSSPLQSESVRRISQLGRVIRIGLYGTLDLEGLVEQRLRMVTQAPATVA